MPQINITVKALDGRTAPLEVDTDDTCLSLKGQIEQALGFPPEYQRLIHVGKAWEDHRKMSDYDIAENDTVFLVLRLRGPADNRQAQSADHISSEQTRKKAEEEKQRRWTSDAPKCDEDTVEEKEMHEKKVINRLHRD